MVSIFGSSTCEGDAGDVVSIFGDNRITGAVSDSAVAVLGNTYIDGKVDGDAVTVLGNIELGPHAEIGGNVVAIGGTLQRDPAAIVHGSVQNIIAGHFGSVGWLRSWIPRLPKLIAWNSCPMNFINECARGITTSPSRTRQDPSDRCFIAGE